MSLLAVAAFAAAGLLWKRRREELRAWYESEEYALENLRRAGF